MPLILERRVVEDIVLRLCEGRRLVRIMLSVRCLYCKGVVLHQLYAWERGCLFCSAFDIVSLCDISLEPSVKPVGGSLFFLARYVREDSLYC